MRLRLGHLFSILACIYLIGGHWVLLQTVAWVGMLADYSHTYGAEKAVAMTFDGAHPCSMCRGIQQKKAENEKQDPLKICEKTTKAFFIPSTNLRLPSPSGEYSQFRWKTIMLQAESWRAAPPQPVPRVLA